MTQDRLNLTDEEYWTDIAKTERSIGDELREKRVSEIIVGVPQFVSLQDRKTIPMRLYKGGTFQDFRELDYDIHGLITAIDVDRNQISIAKTEIPEEFEEDEETEEEDLEGTSQKGYYVMSDDQDLMDRLFDDSFVSPSRMRRRGSTVALRARIIRRRANTSPLRSLRNRHNSASASSTGPL